MLKITEEMREAARKLLKAAELPADAYSYVNDLAKRKQLQAIGKLNRTDRERLEAIANGTRKQIDGRWWREIHHSVVNQPKLDKLPRLADPERNDNIHERNLASERLAEFKARRPPGARPEPPPLPADAAGWMARRKPSAKSAKPKAGPVSTTRPGVPARLASVNTAQAAPSKANPVNTTKPRSADRHLEPNRDRHSPGYMVEYMRKWRARRRGRP